MKMLFIPFGYDMIRKTLRAAIYAATDVTNKTLPALSERSIDSVSFLAIFRLVIVVSNCDVAIFRFSG